MFQAVLAGSYDWMMPPGEVERSHRQVQYTGCKAHRLDQHSVR
ncbi:hypothetical protein [Oscillatoria sp. FACHB-1407]|nr:hypothetical protein [Oscillatoria sp. FACHB-1407]